MCSNIIKYLFERFLPLLYNIKHFNVNCHIHVIPVKGIHFHYKVEDQVREPLYYILEVRRCRANLQWEDEGIHQVSSISNTLDLILGNRNPNIED